MHVSQPQDEAYYGTYPDNVENDNFSTTSGREGSDSPVSSTVSSTIHRAPASGDPRGNNDRERKSVRNNIDVFLTYLIRTAGGRASLAEHTGVGSPNTALSEDQSQAAYQEFTNPLGSYTDLYIRAIILNSFID